MMKSFKSVKGFGSSSLVTILVCYCASTAILHWPRITSSRLRSNEVQREASSWMFGQKFHSRLGSARLLVDGHHNRSCNMGWLTATSRERVGEFSKSVTITYFLRISSKRATMDWLAISRSVVVATIRIAAYSVKFKIFARLVASPSLFPQYLCISSWHSDILHQCLSQQGQKLASGARK